MGLLSQRLYIVKRHLDSRTEYKIPAAIPEIYSEVTVVRQSVTSTIAARDLVPGDILVLRAVSYQVEIVGSEC
jgi:magnesium-transporting ATPase (P-type)